MMDSIQRYRYRHKEELRQKAREYYQRNREACKLRTITFRKNHPEMVRKQNDKRNIQRKALKEVCFGIISKNCIKCMNCGCDDIRLLEINHIDGGGHRKMESGNKIYESILKGVRKTHDLDLRCRTCNALHYHELKYGKLPYRIIWK